MYRNEAYSISKVTLPDIFKTFKRVIQLFNKIKFSVRPSDVLSKYHGESERYLRGVFERARTLPRAVIFFDGNARRLH